MGARVKIWSTATIGLAVALLASRANADEAAPPAPAEEPTVMLHVDSPEVVAIERDDTNELVCTSPCDVKVPATARYRVGGSRVSAPFVLDARKKDATITVAPASKRGMTIGIVALSAGGALAIAGGITLGVGRASSEGIPADGIETSRSYTDSIILGTTLLVTGVAAGIFGGATLLANTKPTVKGDVVKEPPARGDAPSPSRRAAADAASPPIFIVPIVGGTF